MNADDLLRRALESLNDREAQLKELGWGCLAARALEEDIITYLDAPEMKDEPVAWIKITECGDRRLALDCMNEDYKPLYLHPPTKTAPKKPMTVEQMQEAWGQPGHLSTAVLIAYTRAIEWHHDIGGGDE